MHLGQGVGQCGSRDPPAGVTQVRPTQTAVVFAAEDQVEATAQRVTVDEQGPVAVSMRRDRQRAGEGGGAAATPATEDRDQRALWTAALGRVGQPIGQPALGIGQEDDVLGPHLDGLLPDVGVVEVSSEQDDAVAAR